MKNLFIIHSYNGDTKETFGPYIKEQAQKLGIRVYFPDFPIKKEANYKSWSSIMDKYLKNGDLNSESMIIAHSLGTHFIPKYISDRNIPIDLYISCAGFINDHSGRNDLQEIVKEFLPSDEQINRFINLVNNRYSIYSNNDHINPQEELEYYADRIAATRVFIPNIGHMGTKSGITELPEALEIIEKSLNKFNKQL